MVIVAKRKKPTPFGARLRALRDERGHTQPEMAEMVGVSRMTYIRWERGEAEPSYSELCELAAIFGVTLNDFTEPSE